MAIKKTKKKKTTKAAKDKTGEADGIEGVELRCNNFVERFNEDIVEELLIALKTTLHRNSKLMECAESFIRDTSQDVGPRTPKWIINIRCSYLLLMTLPFKTSDVVKKRSGFWFGTHANRLAKMSSTELEMRGGSLIGYKRDSGVMDTDGAAATNKRASGKIKKANKGQGIGEAVMQALRQDISLPFKDAHKMALEINPHSKFSPSSFNWYKNKVKKGG